MLLTPKKKGEVTVLRKKKKKEMIEEQGKSVVVPIGVGAESKPLDQTGDDATSGW